MSATQRLFFAVDLKDAVNAKSREKIIALKASLSHEGRAIPDDNLHLTLAFLGNVSAEQYRQCCDAADAIRARSFQLQTTQTGYFNKPEIRWLGIAPSSSLLTLARQVQTIRRDVLGLPDEHQYLPHISLLRKALPSAQEQMLSVQLHVSRFGLYAQSLEKKVLVCAIPALIIGHCRADRFPNTL
ncbi:RNA 2',3'-cyclic phosphodiesterase [Enterovibrio coralii]|uniref:RNA 2',3'-cyclic phosphodiesterase n=1 Tax=Enterovibrio coralii TaxID=294935 RepID=A0A135I3U0_9GAMM|nr:RNA 2',3'-cyclic phosphodiesterase [Enterovibrio coralii]KXF80112.1 hypothetical protein ATN88_13970 [Enterovibrio coralii]